jgi:hypothetical protein
MMGPDELDEIFVDKNEPADKRLVVDILKGLATIDNDGVIQLTDKGDQLSDNRKVLICLVCKKALILKGLLKSEDEFMGPKEISERMNIGLSSAKKATNETFKKLLRSQNGKYIVPNYNLKKIKIILGEVEEQKISR